MRELTLTHCPRQDATIKTRFTRRGYPVKLVLVVVEDDDAMTLMDALIDAGLSATKLASTGGFLLRGNTTLLIGVEDEQVESVLTTIKRVCKRRKKLLPPTAVEVPTPVSLPIEVETGGSIVFVLEVSQFLKV
jgi:uncharacterized protein YaaQ